MHTHVDPHEPALGDFPPTPASAGPVQLPHISDSEEEEGVEVGEEERDQTPTPPSLSSLGAPWRPQQRQGEDRGTPPNQITPLHHLQKVQWPRVEGAATASSSSHAAQPAATSPSSSPCAPMTETTLTSRHHPRHPLSSPIQSPPPTTAASSFTPSLAASRRSSPRSQPLPFRFRLRHTSCCHLLLLCQLIWLVVLVCFLFFALQPLQSRLNDSIQLLDRALARERVPLTLQPQKPAQPQQERTVQLQVRGGGQMAEAIPMPPLPAPLHFTSSSSAAGITPWPSPRSSSFFFLLPVAQAAEMPSLRPGEADAPLGIKVTHTLLPAEDGFAAAAATDSDEHEFDIFSAEHLASQFILVYHDPDDLVLSRDLLVRQQARFKFHNYTRALLAEYRDELTLVMELDQLPGAVVMVDTEGMEEEEAAGSHSRRRSLKSLLQSIRSRPEVKFISQDQPLSLTSIPGQSVQAGTVVPPGIRRILAASRSTVAQPASVGVAVMDTGIDLKHRSLNAKQGINCITRIQMLVQMGRRVQKDKKIGRIMPELESEFGSTLQRSAAPPVPDSTIDAAPWTPFPYDDPAEPRIFLAQDDNNHGTHVAGIIAGLNNGDGVAGVAPDAVKILNANGQGSWAHLLCGIQWVTANAEKYNIKLASMSLAGSGTNDNACGERNSDALHHSICQSTKAGILFIAAGNSAADFSEVVPASYPEVLAVTAMADSDGYPGSMGPPLTCRGYEDDDHVASFSNYALVPLEDDSITAARLLNLTTTPAEEEWVNAEILQDAVVNHSLPISEHMLAAPGVCILSTVRNNEYAYFSGTSQACPHVTGVVALLYGSGDTTGPCHRLPPTVCMSYVIAQAKQMQQQAGMGFGFYPWLTAQAAKREQKAGTDLLLLEWEEETKPSWLTNDEEGGGKEDEKERRREEEEGGRDDLGEEEDPLEDGVGPSFPLPPSSALQYGSWPPPHLRSAQSRARGAPASERINGVWMRKYYGPVVVGMLP